MTPFQYVRPASVADAVRHMAADASAKVIAGGTNLIDLMKEGVEHPSRLIDITRLPLGKVEETPDGGVRIGSVGGASHDVAGVFSIFTGITIGSSVHAVRYDFCEKPPGSISGRVHADEHEADREACRPAPSAEPVPPRPRAGSRRSRGASGGLHGRR